jgi:prevent-host-death family protein
MKNEHNMIAISEFKATCIQVLEQVRRTGNDVLVTKRGQPIALISPAPAVDKLSNWIGSFKGRGQIIGDIVSPASSENEWETLS